MIVRDKRFDVFTANKRDGELRHLFRSPINEKNPPAGLTTHRRLPAVSVLESQHPATGQPVRVAFVQVGALLVASIRQTAHLGQTLKRGEEVGYFAYGGSTIVAVFPPGCVEWNEDLLSNSEGRNSRGAQLETLVKVSRIVDALCAMFPELANIMLLQVQVVCASENRRLTLSISRSERKSVGGPDQSEGPRLSEPRRGDSRTYSGGHFQGALLSERPLDSAVVDVGNRRNARFSHPM